MARRAATCLRLHLLGTPRWSTELDAQPLKDLDALLIARAAVIGRLNSAEEVTKLWPDHDSSQLNRLDVRLTRLHDALGYDVFKKSKESLELRQGIDIDVLGPLSAWPRPVDPNDACFLAGVIAPRSLTAWLDEQRKRWAAALKAASLLRRAEELESTDALPTALDLVDKALVLAPWPADAWLAKARLLYLTGQDNEADKALSQARALGFPHAQMQASAADLQRTIDHSLAPALRRVSLPVGLMRPPRLIGRENDLAAMGGAWRARRPFVLIGESGMGKSRLMHDFVRDHGGGAMIAADQHDERAPYATLGALLRQVIQQMGVSVADVPPPLAGILGLLVEPRPQAPLDAVAVRDATRDMLLLVAADLRAIGVDRLDRADAASIDVLRELADGALRNSLLFAFAACPPVPGPRRDAIEAWCAAPDGAVAVVLAPWGQEHLAELLATLERPGAAAKATPAWLQMRSHGVPQLALFALQDLATREALPAPPSASEELSSGIVKNLQERVRAVPSSARSLMGLSAVLDGSTAMFARALQCAEADVEAMAADLVLHGVMFEGRVVHDLMRNAVLASLAPAAVQRWNAVAASMLSPDMRVPRARIGAHWEAAGRSTEAAAAYRAAALHAEDVGRMAEARELLHQAAACFMQAKDSDGEFSALNDVVLSERHLFGHQAAQRLVDRLHALAAAPRQHVQVAIARALLAVYAYRRDDSALPVAEAARVAADALGEPELRATALSLEAAALAQAGRHAEAVVAGHAARRLAVLATAPRKARAIATDLCYVFYEASQLDDGIALSRDLLADYEAVGDLARAGSVQSNLATLLVLTGDPEASIAHGLSALDRHRAVERSALSDAAVMNRVGLVQALGYAGRFAEADALLFEDGRCIDTSPVLPEVRAKVQLVRAHLLLLLGDDAGAVAALDKNADAWPTGMQAQRCWALARASTMRGEDAAPEMQHMARLLASLGDTPLAHAPWLEWSRLGDPAQVNERLRAMHRRHVEAGMLGVARTVLLRRIARLSELRLAFYRNEAAALAIELCPQVHKGLHASIYLPQAWLTIAGALRSGGDEMAAQTCLSEAQRWVLETALPNVPDRRRDAFMMRNAVNRALFDSANGGTNRPSKPVDF